MFFRNSDHVQWALKPRAGSFVERLARMSDAGAMAEELYLSVLTRLPAEDEKAALAGWLAKHAADRPRAVADFAWALVSSTEFFVNH